MEAYIAAHPYMVYLVVMLLAALFHWGWEVKQGRATPDFVAYWFTETPGYSFGTIGSLIGIWWVIVISNGLGGGVDATGAPIPVWQWHMIIEGAFMTGLGINHLVSPGTAKALTSAGNKVAGFILPAQTLFVLGLGILMACVLSGCAIGPQAKVPDHPPEQIEAFSKFCEKLSDGVTDLTCTQFEHKLCIEPGKPLMPDDALAFHDKLEKAHDGLAAAAGIGAGQVGACMGSQRTQGACVAAASAILMEVDRMLIAQKRGNK